MVVLGLSLTAADFRRVVAAPRGVAIGMANLLVVAPALAFAIAALFSLPAVLAVGLVLLGASPGGTMANLLTHLARGDVALSVTMTGVSSVAAVVTVPVYLGLAVEHFGAGALDVEVDLLAIVARVLAITVVPLAIGMGLRQRYPKRVAEVYGRARVGALALFVLVVIGAVASEAGRVIDNLAEVAAAALALNVAAMGAGYLLARAGRLRDRQATAIAMELGVHNATLAIAVAASIDTAIAIPAAIYSAFMFVTAGAFARLMAARNAEPAGGAPVSVG